MKRTLIFTLRWAIALLVSWSLMISPVSAKTYRWTDDSGNTVYSQTPPPDGRSRETVKAPPPPAESPEAAQKKLQEQIDQLKGQREARQESKQKSEQAKQEAAALARDCETARNNLQTLRQGTRRLYRSHDGSVSRLSEEEKNTRIREAEAFIQEKCQ